MHFFHRLLLWLPPETAHALAKAFLQCLQWIRFHVQKRPFASPASIVVPQCGFRFPARVGVAAGLDKNAEIFAGLAVLGAGFVEVGTVTPLPQPGNPKPRLWRPAAGTLVNHMGFNSVGLEVFSQNIRRYRSRLPGFVLLANIGKNRTTPNADALADYAKGFQALQGLVDGFVVNLSSPNTPGLMQLQSEEFLAQIAQRVPAGVPVWIKLSPDLENAQLDRLATAVRDENRLAGIVLTNTSREMAEEVFSMPAGGLSGRPLFSRAIECVSIARQALGHKKSLIGVGGVWNRASAKQMRRAGADLVEVYTGLVYQGPGLLRELAGLD